MELLGALMRKQKNEQKVAKIMRVSTSKITHFIVVIYSALG
jgi:hypothetical protein